MVNVIDLLADYKSNRQFKSDLNDAWEQYRNQVIEIRKISKTNGFKEIINYWDREVKACEARLSTMKRWDIEWIQGELKVAKRFLDFIENINSADIDLPSN